MVFIKEAAQDGAYWIGSKFVFACNWEISKHRFTKEEQLKFEKHLENEKLIS